MVGASTKTVRRHLDSMISDGSLDMSMPMDGLSGGYMFLIMHVSLRGGANKREVGRRLLSKHYFQDQYFRTLSNLPNLLVWVFWSDKITEVRKVLRETSEDEDVTSVMLNFAYLERIYPTWRDELPEVRAPHSEKGRPHRTRPRIRRQ